MIMLRSVAQYCRVSADCQYDLCITYLTQPLLRVFAECHDIHLPGVLLCEWDRCTMSIATRFSTERIAPNVWTLWEDLLVHQCQRATSWLVGPTCLIWSNLATAVQGTIHFSGSTTGGMEVSSLIIFSRSHCCIIPRLLSATSILGKLVQISGSKFPTLQADVGCQLWAFGSLPARWLADGREGWRVWARLPLNLQDVSYVSS